MSHQPERKEKDCLNCGTIVQGRYCQHCGQENIITKQGFWSLTSHFISDIFHFDGKFFETLKRLLLKPGYVPKEYIRGRRQRFLDPIRMYLFTSAVFFLVFFAYNKLKPFDIGDSRTMNRDQRTEAALELTSRSRLNGDTALLRQAAILMDSTKSIRKYYDTIVKPADSINIVQLQKDTFFMVVRERPAIDTSEGGTFFAETTRKRWRELNRKYGDDESSLFADMGNAFLHLLPYMLFISLPFFALILKLVYVRRKIYYSDHAVFTLYHYIFSFILLLFVLLLIKAENQLDWDIMGYLATILLIYGGIYLLLSMKRFYGQGWGKTVLKFIIVNILGLIMLLLLMIIFGIFSSYQI